MSGNSFKLAVLEVELLKIDLSGAGGKSRVCTCNFIHKKWKKQYCLMIQQFGLMYIN
jgi:hypothetical protein